MIKRTGIAKDVSYHFDHPGSDVAIKILKVGYRGSRYCKVKAVLYNKRNLIVYETKNFKLFYDKINHWKVLRRDG